MSEEINWNGELDETLLQDLYAWIDQIPLSRPKRKIERDFADGVMMAELVKFYFPSWIELHNYAAANNTQQKMINWGLLNRKVLSKFDINLPENIMRGICLGKTGLVEVLLYNLRMKIDDYLYSMEGNTTDPEYRNLFRKGKEQSKQIPRSSERDYPEPNGMPKQNSKPQSMASLRGKPTLVNPSQPLTGNVVNEMVPRLLYEEKAQECLANEEQIAILNAKIKRLEHLLHLKDVRIQDLTDKANGNQAIRRK